MDTSAVNFINIYTNPKIIQAIKFDSVKISGSDTLLINFRVIRDTSQGYLCNKNPYAPSWIGPAVIIKPDGINIFNNSRGDTIIIDCDAPTAANWIFYRDADTSKYIIATVEAIKDTIYSGIHDSVKIIRLTASTLTAPLSLFNNTRIVLSRSHGILELFDFYNMPENEDYQPVSHYHFYSNRNITYRDVFDFDTGDEFHIKIHDYGPPPFYDIIVREILAKNVSPDSTSVAYTCRKVFYDFWYNTSTYTSGCDTMITIETDSCNYRNEYIKEKSPEESTFSISGMDLTAYSLFTNNDYNNRLILDDYMGDNMYSFADSCWGEPFEAHTQWTTYIKGCGSYSGHFFAAVQDLNYEELFFFKKGSETWGTPYGISKSDDILNKINVFPNPFNECIELHFTDLTLYKQIVIEIIDIAGNRIFMSEPTHLTSYNSVIEIHPPKVTPGVYIIVIKTPLGNAFRKLIKI